MKKTTILTLLIIVSFGYAFSQFDYNEKQKIIFFEKEDTTIDTLLKGFNSQEQGILSKNSMVELKWDSAITYTFSSPKDSLYSAKSIYRNDEEDNSIYINVYSWHEEGNAWRNAFKFEKEYDDQNRFIAYVDYIWQRSEENWKPFLKSEIAYHESGKIRLIESYRWNDLEEKWEGHRKQESDFDLNGNEVLFIRYTWGSMDEWIGLTKTVRELNESGRTKISYGYGWDIVNNSWDLSGKTEYEYDDSENKIVRQSYYMLEDVWVNKSKSITQYKDNKQLLSHIGYQWDTENGVWVYYEKEERCYDESNSMISRVTYDWDKENNKWIGDYRYERVKDYSGNGNLSKTYLWDIEKDDWLIYSKSLSSTGFNSSHSERYLRDHENDKWVGYDKKYREFDADSNKTLETYYEWDTLTDGWIGDRTYKNIYDSDGNRVVNEHYIWNKDAFAFAIWKKTFYFASNAGLPMENPISKTSIFPNPAKDFFRVKAKSPIHRIDVYDLAGNKKKSYHDLNMDFAISTGDLKSGMYILQIHTVEGIIKRKIFIQQ